MEIETKVWKDYYYIVVINYNKMFIKNNINEYRIEKRTSVNNRKVWH